MRIHGYIRFKDFFIKQRNRQLADAIANQLKNLSTVLYIKATGRLAISKDRATSIQDLENKPSKVHYTF